MIALVHIPHTTLMHDGALLLASVRFVSQNSHPSGHISCVFFAKKKKHTNVERFYSQMFTFSVETWRGVGTRDLLGVPIDFFFGQKY